MKTLILALSLISPLTASAHKNTVLTCEDRVSVAYSIITNAGLLQGGVLTLVANGILHTVIDSRIDEVRHPSNSIVAVDVTTMNADGISDDSSGKATFEFDLLPGEEGKTQTPAGTARIHLTKAPPQHPDNIIFQPEYVLTGCKGAL